MNVDLFNALFEFGGALLSIYNIVRILKDRQIKGVFWPATAFWSVWGYWNMYYYVSLHQPLSFVAGALLTVSNTIWVILAVYYSKKNHEI